MLFLALEVDKLSGSRKTKISFIVLLLAIGQSSEVVQNIFIISFLSLFYLLVEHEKMVLK